MHMHRMCHEAFIEVMHHHGFADLERIRRGGGKRLPIQRQPDGSCIIQHHHHFLLCFAIGIIDLCASCTHSHLFPIANDERTSKSVRYLHLGIVMRVIHAYC